MACRARAPNQRDEREDSGGVGSPSGIRRVADVADRLSPPSEASSASREYKKPVAKATALKDNRNAGAEGGTRTHTSGTPTTP